MGHPSRAEVIMSCRSSVLFAVLVIGCAGNAWAGEGYVGMSGTDSLVVLDLETGSTVGSSIDLLPEGDYPYDATILPDGSEVWICGAVGDGIVVVDTATRTVIERIDLSAIGEYPVNIAFDATGTIAYVTANDSEAIVLVDVATHTVTGTTIDITGGLGPGKGRVRESDGRIFIVDWYGSRIHSIDPVTHVVESDSIGNSLWDLAIHPSGSPIYAIDRGTDLLHVYDPASSTVTTSVPVGDDPWGLDVTPDGSKVFVANEDSSNLTVVDTATNTVITTILLAGGGAEPRDVDIIADGSLAYVPQGGDPGNDAVLVIDTATLTQVDVIAIGGDDDSNVIAVAPEPLGGFIFGDGFESGDTTAWSGTVP
jgi:YVTN family beta-propeller protein